MSTSAPSRTPWRRDLSVIVARRGVADVIPVDGVVRGCPPTPQQLLHALLDLIGE